LQPGIKKGFVQSCLDCCALVEAGLHQRAAAKDVVTIDDDRLGCFGANIYTRGYQVPNSPLPST
jgi:hypothetical protein